MDIWTADQRKYDIDADSPLLKRVAFRVFCWIVEFCFEKWKFVPWDHRDSYGNWSWLERQGLFTEHWRAAQEAAKYPHGISIKMHLNEAQPAETIHGIQVQPHNGNGYSQRINGRMVEVPLAAMARLEKKLVETDPHSV